VLSLQQAYPSRVVGVVMAEDSDVAFRAALAAVDGGLGTLEVSMSVPSCLDIVRGLVASMLGSVPVGVGTVWDPAVIPEVKRAGASFVVTSTFVPAVAAACAREELLCVMGALTPTEIRQAWRAGASAVHVFPVQSMGGPGYIRWLRGPMPDVPICVSGGIELDQVDEFLREDIVAVGLTTALFPPDALSRGDMSMITRLARRAAAATVALRT
jgi:2-dehydro-3-deoxyphosphogluconate aldolase/(4S)-4-hydroxy-2-oxoglutarate aldolase